MIILTASIYVETVGPVEIVVKRNTWTQLQSFYPLVVGLTDYTVAYPLPFQFADCTSYVKIYSSFIVHHFS